MTETSSAPTSSTSLRADLIDGRAIAAAALKELSSDVKWLKRQPHLAIIMAGESEPSRVYVENKLRAAAGVGIKATLHACPENVTQERLLARLLQLNIDPTVDGIIIQLPLPAHIDRTALLAALNPAKDVDGLTFTSQGRLFTGMEGFVPCTPKGCVRLIDSVTSDLEGAEAVVVGRSQLVGQPLAQLLLQRGCTVTVAHKATRDLGAVTRRADILCVAVGVPNLIRGAMIKPGAIVIDVGINRGADGKLVGDVCFEEAMDVASAITPVPGGVGPMTIACLLENTVYAMQHAPAPKPGAAPHHTVAAN